MKSEKQVGQAFEDHIHKIGAPVGLKSDNAKSELHGRTKDILRLYSIGATLSTPEPSRTEDSICQTRDEMCNFYVDVILPSP